MSINPQSQSAFITRLPAEVRDTIYLELWRSSGLRQHVQWHGRWPDGHFCSWPCTTEYEVGDGLQRDIEELRRRLDVPLGERIRKSQDPETATYLRRLQSPWLNHWACGERAEQEHGLNAIGGLTTSEIVCWRKNREQKQHAPSRSPYLPMLLSCKLISEQCIRSIYESTTFVFTDMYAFLTFVGCCELHPPTEFWTNSSITPPSFYKYAKTIELSLSSEFPAVLPYARVNQIPREGHCQDIYDFHWLGLDQFQNLQVVNIWIAARSTNWIPGEDTDDGSYNFTGITELDADALGKAFTPLGRVASVTISTPLGPSVGPEDGYVEGIAGRVRIYKRGSGNIFHPRLNIILPVGEYDHFIYTSTTREVRIGRNGGTYVIMKRV